MKVVQLLYRQKVPGAKLTLNCHPKKDCNINDIVGDNMVPDSECCSMLKGYLLNFPSMVALAEPTSSSPEKITNPKP